MVLASARRSAWRVATQRVAPAVLNRALAYYNFDMENRRNFMNAYARYMTALNNTTAVAARRNAQAAATKFVNTMFKVYEKSNKRQPGPVANGIGNGVQKSLIYWLPGVIYRRAIRQPQRRARTAPKSSFRISR
jgi:hypothetical protein